MRTLYPEEAEQYHQDDLAVIRSGVPKLGIVELYQGASGEKRWVQTDKVPYRDHEGRVIGVLVFAQDITDRRRGEEALQASEARFRAFMDHSPVLAFMKDEEGRYVYGNRAWQRFVGVESRSWKGLTDEEIWPPALAAACRASDRRVIQEQRSIEAIESYIGPHGRQRSYMIVKFPIVNGLQQRLVGGIAQEISSPPPTASR